MAMTQCKECGHQVSTKAEACPSCGAKRPRSSGCLTLMLVGAGVCFVFVVGLMIRVRETPPAQALVPPAPEQPTKDDSPPPPAKPADAPPPIARDPWVYSNEQDAMGGGITHVAKILSSNEIELTFPYGGPQRAMLGLRSSPRSGKDVIFAVVRGQLQCFDECEVLVRFDDEPAVNYTATGPEDNSSQMLFLRNYARFVDKLSRAKRLRLSVTLFQQGSRMFEFNVSGFDPRKYGGEAAKPARAK